MSRLSIGSAGDCLHYSIYWEMDYNTLFAIAFIRNMVSIQMIFILP